MTLTGRELTFATRPDHRRPEDAAFVVQRNLDELVTRVAQVEAELMSYISSPAALWAGAKCRGTFSFTDDDYAFRALGVTITVEDFDTANIMPAPGNGMIAVLPSAGWWLHIFELYDFNKALTASAMPVVNTGLGSERLANPIGGFPITRRSDGGNQSGITSVGINYYSANDYIQPGGWGYSGTGPASGSASLTVMKLPLS